MALIGNSNSEKIWNYFSKLGMSKFGIAGLIGNLDCESALNPINLEDQYERKLGYTNESYTNAVDNYAYNGFVNDCAGYGLCQWTWWTRKQSLLNYARQSMRSIGDLEMQLDFLKKELTESFPDVWSTLMNAGSVLEASNAVLLRFERPSDMSVSAQTYRASVGQKYYNKYATKAVTEYTSEVTANMGYYTLNKGTRKQLSANFASNEFDCHGVGCCSTTTINELLVKYCQQIGDHFKKPITVTSGYRCPTHNRNIGGATGSRHSMGDAADIVVADTAPRVVAQYAESIGIKGIGLYETSADGFFVHIDTRPTKSFWYGQAQAFRSTFGVYTGGTVSAQPSQSTAQTSGVIKYGDTGSAVLNLQKNLIRLGYSCGTCGADGSFGLGTLLAVKALQKDAGFSYKDQDGVVGPMTDAAISKMLAGTTATTGGDYYYVTADVLNVRSGPGMNNKIVAAVKYGSTLLITEQKDGWGKFSAGWVSMNYVQRKG